MKKTFLVADSDGNRTIEAEQLATFAYYIQGEQFRFVVTHAPRINTVALTHRTSGKRVAEVPHISIQAARGDYKLAGEGALKALIARVGEARLRSVLAAAE